MNEIELFFKNNLDIIDEKLKTSLKSATFSFEKMNLSLLLNYVSCEQIFFFKSKYHDFCFLGLGSARTITAEELNNYLIENPKNFLISTFLFESAPHASSFVLPEWSFISTGNQTELLINPVDTTQIFSSSDLFFNLNHPPENYFLNPHINYQESPNQAKWNEMIDKCDSFFNENKLLKIVLSRQKIFSYPGPINPVQFFGHVFKINNQAPSTYAIFYQLNFKQAFLSLTPEKLFSLNQGNFETISLAASAKRSHDLKEDQALEDFLISNEKLIREQDLVTDDIFNKMKPLMKNLFKGKFQIMKLPYIQHRATPISGKIHSHFGAIDLVKTLHPTPAVGGLPSSFAQSKIKELEPFKRNHYAAPIGVINLQFSELAVGIRSAFIDHATLTLYGGAGIIKGSNALEEWMETEIKMNPFLNAMNNE